MEFEINIPLEIWCLICLQNSNAGMKSIMGSNSVSLGVSGPLWGLTQMIQVVS